MTSLEFDMVKACSKRLGEGPLVSCKLGWRSKEKPGLTSFSREIIPGGNFSVLREQGTKFDTDSSFNGGGNGGWGPPPETEETEEATEEAETKEPEEAETMEPDSDSDIEIIEEVIRKPQIVELEDMETEERMGGIKSEPGSNPRHPTPSTSTGRTSWRPSRLRLVTDGSTLTPTRTAKRKMLAGISWR